MNPLKPVRVHYNLHRGDWVITQGGKVCAYADELALTSVTYHYTPSIKARAFENKGRKPKRSVHLWAQGMLCEMPSDTSGREVTYNPFKHDGFVYRDNGEAFQGSKSAVFLKSKQMIVS